MYTMRTKAPDVNDPDMDAPKFFMLFRLYVTKYDFWVAHDVDLWKFRCYRTMLLNIENRLVERLNRKSKKMN